MEAKIRAFCLGVSLMLLSFGCGHSEIPAPAVDPDPVDTTVVIPPMSADTLTYLALGDSYTIGQSVLPAGRFPEQLAARLREDSIPVAPVRIIARTGWTTSDLKAALSAAFNLSNFSGAPYGLVTLLIGVNNQYRGLSLSGYQAEFSELLQTAIVLAGYRKERVFVLSIPDYGATPFGAANAQQIAQQIDAFNAANRAITEATGVAYINITPISREARQDPSLIASDNLHPSAAMYRRWVELLLPEVRAALEK